MEPILETPTDQLAALLPSSRIDNTYEVSSARFHREVIARNYRYIRADRFPTGEVTLDHARDLGDEIVLVSRDGEILTDGVIAVDGDMVARLDASVDAVTAIVAGDDLDRVREEGARIRGILEKPEAGEDPNTIGISFHAMGNGGHGTMRQRTLDAPDLPEIAANYDTPVRAELERLCALTPDAVAGRVLLWRGEPGTGKTTALRALLRAWRPWCSGAFITDPERFLGAGTEYLMSVLAGEPWQTVDEQRWRLLILEDAGELVSVDAKRETGQALSRLLNAADGLIGQGTRMLVVITTNEPIDRVHPAVHRPGRCMSELEFTSLPADAANRWLERAGCPDRVRAATTLAELYARAAGSWRPAERRALGFGS